MNVKGASLEQKNSGSRDERVRESDDAPSTSKFRKDDDGDESSSSGHPSNVSSM